MKLIIQQEIALHQVWFNTNKSVVERLISPKFSEVEESGRSFNFYDVCAFMDNDKRSEDRVHSQDFEVVQLEQKSVLLLYKSALLSSTGQYSRFAKRSSVWIRENNLWKMRYHQGTHCEPFEIKA